jgi:hypothetical protein
MTPAEKIWWLKIAVAFGTACLTLVLQLYLNMNGTTVFMFGVLVYVMISEIMARFFNIDNARALKIGVGAFFFSWVMIWVFLNTILL